MSAISRRAALIGVLGLAVGRETPRFSVRRGMASAKFVSYPWPRKLIGDPYETGTWAFPLADDELSKEQLKILMRGVKGELELGYRDRVAEIVRALERLRDAVAEAAVVG